jgi:hypothetical protein
MGAHAAAFGGRSEPGPASRGPSGTGKPIAHTAPRPRGTHGRRRGAHWQCARVKVICVVDQVPTAVVVTVVSSLLSRCLLAFDWILPGCTRLVPVLRQAEERGETNMRGRKARGRRWHTTSKSKGGRRGFVPPGLMGPASPAGPTEAGSVVPAPLPWSMPTPSPSQAPSHSPSGGHRGVPRIPYHSVSKGGFCTTPLGGVPGGPGAARRLPRACRRS